MAQKFLKINALSSFFQKKSACFPAHTKIGAPALVQDVREITIFVAFTASLSQAAQTTQATQTTQTTQTTQAYI